MSEFTFVDDVKSMFTKPRFLNNGRLKVRLDHQMEPETCSKPLGYMGDSPQADVAVERGRRNRVRTTTDHGDSTTPF